MIAGELQPLVQDPHEEAGDHRSDEAPHAVDAPRIEQDDLVVASVKEHLHPMAMAAVAAVAAARLGFGLGRSCGSIRQLYFGYSVVVVAAAGVHHVCAMVVTLVIVVVHHSGK